MTASVSPSRPNTGTVRTGPGISRPNPTATRSPTVPPVVQTPVTTGSYRVGLSQSHSVPQLPTLPPAGFFKRSWGGLPGWMVMSALALVGFAFVGGAIVALRGPSGGTTVRGSIPEIQLLDLAFETTPTGADVFVVGSNEYLGRTPFRRKVEYRTDRSTFVVFRLGGYLDTTKEVRPEWVSGLSLQPAPPQPVLPKETPPALPPVPPPTVPPPIVTPPTVTPRPVRPGKDPLEHPKPNRPKGKGKGKGGDKVSDPFETGGAGRKASPFD